MSETVVGQNGVTGRDALELVGEEYNIDRDLVPIRGHQTEEKFVMDNLWKVAFVPRLHAQVEKQPTNKHISITKS